MLSIKMLLLILLIILFVNVGFNLAKEIPNTGIEPCSFIKSENMNTFFINPVDSVEVKNVKYYF